MREPIDVGDVVEASNGSRMTVKRLERGSWSLARMLVCKPHGQRNYVTVYADEVKLVSVAAQRQCKSQGGT